MWLTPERKIALRQFLVWMGITLFCVVFLIVYYSKSHGVTSPFMSEVYLPSLCLMVLYGINLLWGRDVGSWVRFFFNAGTGTLAVYLALRGVYAIGQASSSWSDFFLYLALAMYLIGTCLAVASIVKRKRESNHTWF